MLSPSAAVRIFVCLEPVDLRKSFDGLFALVQHHLHLDPLSGHLFVFRNRSGQRLKILYWDRDGLALWYKRLEQGTFQLPTPVAGSADAGREISAADLAMLLEGIDLGAARRRRYRRPAARPTA